jgi:uncharacterized coiled-coil protein SlyX
MICSRLDKIEAMNGQTKATVDEINEVVNRTESTMAMLERMVNHLRDGMSAFSKSLFGYLRGESG